MKNPLLIEIGLEELPPLLIKHLSKLFCDSIKKRLGSLGYETGGSKSYGTPRRIACVIDGIPEKQNSKAILKRGPGFNRAFDADGNPTKAALGFAQSCGVDLKELERFETKKMEFGWLIAQRSKEVILLMISHKWLTKH